MDSEEDDYFQENGSDWSEEEEAADCTDYEDGGENNDSAAVDGWKPYKILTEEDIKHLQENDIATISAVLSVPRGIACALLCRNNWSLISVYDHWFAAAANNDGERNPESFQHICKICYENTDPKGAVSAACGHSFCADCMKSYIAAAVSGGAGCLTLECPETGCGAAVTSDMVVKLASEADVSRYHQYLRRSYVESSRNRKWCPAAGCDRAIELDAAGIDSYDCDVVCGCSHTFCLRCSGEPHSPLGCTAAAEWSESARWILANTKACPKCRRPIEKAEGGCDQMVCVAPCGYEFCWTCLYRWMSKKDEYFCCFHCAKGRERQEMGISISENADGSNQCCSFFMAKPKTKAKRSFTDGNCYERWDFDEESRKIAMAELEKARKKYTGEERVGTEFVVEAWEQIVECWRVLIWSYVYVCSLPEAMVKKRSVLEHFHAVAEVAFERLQRCMEEEEISDGGALFGNKLRNLTKVARHCIQSLVLAMKNEVDGYAPYWDKEALELKDDVAIAESIALDLEKEDFEAENHMAIALSYAFDLERKENPDYDKEKKNDNLAEVGSRVFNLEKEAMELKNNLAEVGHRVVKVEKEAINLKNDLAEAESHALDLEKEALGLKNDLAQAGSSSLNVKNDLGEDESRVLDLEKKALDLKNDLAEVGSSSLKLKSDLGEVESCALNLKNDLGEVESCALELEKKALDLKNILVEVGSFAVDMKDDRGEVESYVVVSEKGAVEVNTNDLGDDVLVSEDETSRLEENGV